MKGHKLSYEMVQTVYPYLWAEIFPHVENYESIPVWVYVFFDGTEYVGFLSGKPANKDTIDIQWAGIIEQKRGVSSLPTFIESLEFIHKDYKYIRGSVHNENITALKMAMKAGFRIFGVRMLSGLIFVELLKIDKEIKNG